MEGRFLLFINFRQAAMLGHVGWGFLLGDGQTYMFGSTDHLYRHKWWDLLGWIDYMDVQPGMPTDWWCSYGAESEMLQMMSGKLPNYTTALLPKPKTHALFADSDKRERRHIWYHSAKAIRLANCRAELAEAYASGLENAGWNILSNNCVQQTFDVMKAYGLEGIVPDPWANALNLIPRIWFDSLEGEQILLNPYP